MDSQSTDRDALDALLRKVQGSSRAAEADGSFPGTEAPFEIAGSAALSSAEAEPRHMRPELLRSVHLRVRVELGRIRMPLKDALELGPGSLVDLERTADDPVDIFVNDLLIARGEVFVVNDCFCVRVMEVFSETDSREAGK